MKSLSKDKQFDIAYLSSGKWGKLDKLGMVFSTAVVKILTI